MPSNIEIARQQIHNKRIALGLTIAQAAEAADISYQQWSYFEWNARSVPPHFKRMCEVVEIDPTGLLREMGIL